LLICFVMAPSSQELEPPANPGQFSFGGCERLEFSDRARFRKPLSHR
jgi:hypothetical protein